MSTGFVPDAAPTQAGFVPDKAVNDIHAIVDQAADAAGIPRALYRRVVQTESTFNPKAVSPQGARGLAQLMPDTAKMLGVKNIDDPRENAYGGARYLAQLLKKYKGNEKLALAAYNAGPGAVDAAGGVPKIAETQKYVKSTASPPPVAAPQPYNPMQGFVPDSVRGSGVISAVGSVAGGAFNNAASGLSTLAGHQDIMFILMNAAWRDHVQNPKDQRGFVQLLSDPTSTVSHALQLWKKNPTQAMDEFGAASPRQNAWLKAHSVHSVESWLADHPILNATLGAAEEMFNPVALAEGGAAGKVLGWLGHAMHATSAGQKARGIGQGAASIAGFGSPLYAIGNRAGKEGVGWVNALLNVTQAPEKFLKVPRTETITQQIFAGLDKHAQTEVVRLSQGLNPDPKFFQQYNDLTARAALLKHDIAGVTQQQVRTKLLDPKTQVHKNFFPMADSYEFEIPPTVEANRKGLGIGARRTASKQKVFADMDTALASGRLREDFLPANNYAAWRRARLQMVGFEDMLAQAPKSLRLPANKGLRKLLVQNQGIINGKEYHYYENLRGVFSPQMRRGAWAPEATDFISSSPTVKRFVEQGIGALEGPGGGGEIGNWGRKFIGFARTMIILNPGWHPIVNISKNASAARGMAGIPSTAAGVAPELGGFLIESARATAYLLGVKPEQFVGGAQQYAKWLDRALRAGATGEFGPPVKSALGGERAHVLTVPPKTWTERLDKALTRFGSWNRDQVFGSRGEEAFAVSLFRDAVESRKYTDAEASAIVREALHDYYNFNPNSVWGAIDLFMPWRKGNTKFWLGVLAKKPQYLTSITHGIRNYNEQTGPAAMRSPYAANDFRINIKGVPLTAAFPGKDVVPLVNAAFGKQDPLAAGQQALLGSANPVTRLGIEALITAKASYSPEVAGPELGNWDILYNPKAPGYAKAQQFFGSLAGHLPLPVIGFAFQEAMRRGWGPEQFMSAAASAFDLGYVGQRKLSSGARMQKAAAVKEFKRSANRYTHETHDERALENAWKRYMKRLDAAKAL